jgi:hypothetical protein
MLNQTLTISQVAVTTFVSGALAASITALVSLRIAKSQIRATVLSGNRKKWIDQVRAQIAEFMALCITIYVPKSRQKNASEMDSVASSLDRLYLIKFTIELLINPKEEDHKNLCSLLDQAVSNLARSEPNNIELEKTLSRIKETSQAILKREWIRVKDLR